VKPVGADEAVRAVFRVLNPPCRSSSGREGPTRTS
jgi:hypothetical protein